MGNITAEEKVEIAPDGRVVGDLRAPRIIISDGAAFRGKIDMQNFDEEREAKTNSGQPAATIAIVEPALPAESDNAVLALVMPASGTTTPKSRGRH